MKETVYKKLLEFISSLDKEDSRIATYNKIVTLMNSARIFDDENMLKITYDRITNPDYELKYGSDSISYSKNQMLEIGKTLMEGNGYYYSSNDEVVDFLNKNKDEDIYTKLIYNSLKNRVYTHCFNGAFLDDISKNNGLNTNINKNDFEKLDRIFSKVGIRIPEYYISHTGKVYFSENPTPNEIDYLASSPEWFRIFINQFDVTIKEYYDRDYDKIVEHVGNKFKEIEDSKILSNEELSHIKEFMSEQVSLLCQKINPYMAVYHGEINIESFDNFKIKNKNMMNILSHFMFNNKEIVRDGLVEIDNLDIVEVPLYNNKSDNKKKLANNSKR